jgi:hypothetical protein
VACAVAAVVFAAVGFCGGRLTASEEVPTSIVQPMVERVPPSSHVPFRPSGSRSREATGPESPAPIASQAATLSGDEAGEAGEAAAEPLDLEPLLSAARALRDAVDDHEVAEVARQAADELFLRLAGDPGALAQAIERFQGLSDEHELGMLAAVLGRLADPEVEQAALSMAERGSAAQRAAALDVLDNLDVPSARGAALAALARETDALVRRAAVRAVPPPAGTTLEQAREVRDALGRVLSRDPDAEARRQASIALASYATGAEELRPVLGALRRDADANVRAGAAFALEAAGRRDPVVLASLEQALREGEDPLVRENAWQALRALSPLPPSAHAAYVAFAAEREARQEALAE